MLVLRGMQEQGEVAPRLPRLPKLTSDASTDVHASSRGRAAVAAFAGTGAESVEQAEVPFCIAP
jgi:hypothetical protein